MDKQTHRYMDIVLRQYPLRLQHSRRTYTADNCK